MASPYSVLALDAAGWLDAELASVAAQMSVPGQLDGAARDHLVRVLAAARSTTRQFREHVARAAAVGSEAAIEVCEHALRARGDVMLRALQALAGAEAEIPAVAFVGGYRSVLDLAEHLTTRLAAIQERWLRERTMNERFDFATRNALVYAALDEAEIALERIGRDPLLQTFLRIGLSCSSVSVRTACLEVGVSVGAGLDLALPHFAAPPGIPDAVEGRRRLADDSRKSRGADELP